MEGEKKLLLVVVGVCLVCLTVLYSFLFIALWQYKEIVGGSLLGIALLAFAVYLRGRLNEQDLRVIRFKHHEETPLDDNGEPLYCHQGFQVNPHRK